MKVLEAQKKLCPFMGRNHLSSIMKKPKDESIVRADGDVEMEVATSNGLMMCQTKNCMAWESVSEGEGYCVEVEKSRSVIKLGIFIEGIAEGWLSRQSHD